MARRCQHLFGWIVGRTTFHCMACGAMAPDDAAQEMRMLLLDPAASVAMPVAAPGHAPAAAQPPAPEPEPEPDPEPEARQSQSRSHSRSRAEPAAASSAWRAPAPRQNQRQSRGRSRAEPAAASAAASAESTATSAELPIAAVQTTRHAKRRRITRDSVAEALSSTPDPDMMLFGVASQPSAGAQCSGCGCCSALEGDYCHECWAAWA